MKSRKPLWVIISSPSGVGKTTVISAILGRNPTYGRSVSVTCRPSRKDEESGRAYFFVTEKKFRQLIKKNRFLEWAKVHGYFYGTLKSYIQDLASKKAVILFSLDVRGGLSLKKKYPQALLIFLLPPSKKVLRQRLLKRKTDLPEQINRRLRNASGEIKNWNQYDYIVINKNLNETVLTIENIINSEQFRTGNFDFSGWKASSGF